METSTSRTISKIKAELVKDFVSSVGEDMRAAGSTDREIQAMFNLYIELRQKTFYSKKRDAKHIGKIAKKVLKKADSKIENIFFKIFTKNKIPFQFQYRIGPYKADFLVKRKLVVEMDGPHHNTEKRKKRDLRRDLYMKKMGYRIMRIPAWLAASCEEAVVDAVKSELSKNY